MTRSKVSLYEEEMLATGIGLKSSSFARIFVVRILKKNRLSLQDVERIFRFLRTNSRNSISLESLLNLEQLTDMAYARLSENSDFSELLAREYEETKESIRKSDERLRTQEISKSAGVRIAGVGFEGGMSNRRRIRD